MTYRVKLKIFEGPLDLLLHLIKKDALNIYDIPISRITEQYLQYLELMRLLDLEIAGDFLVMAATLMQIKSRMLLPPEETEAEEEEEDPREELVRKLLDYKRFKEAAGRLRGMEERRRLLFTRSPETVEGEAAPEKPYFEVSLFDLISAFSKILKDASREVFREIIKDEFTVEEKILHLESLLGKTPVVYFTEIFRNAKNKGEIIVTFLALLELIRLKKAGVRQKEKFGEIEIVRNDVTFSLSPV